MSIRFGDLKKDWTHPEKDRFLLSPLRAVTAKSKDIFPSIFSACSFGIKIRQVTLYSQKVKPGSDRRPCIVPWSLLPSLPSSCLFERKHVVHHEHAVTVMEFPQTPGGDLGRVGTPVSIWEGFWWFSSSGGHLSPTPACQRLSAALSKCPPACYLRAFSDSVSHAENAGMYLRGWWVGYWLSPF